MDECQRRVVGALLLRFITVRDEAAAAAVDAAAAEPTMSCSRRNSMIGRAAQTA